MIHTFNSDGLLPPGDYKMNLDEIRESILVKGPEDGSENWDQKWRLQLINNCEILVEQLVRVGIIEIYINGSFVEDKDHPNDIDGYFECEFSKFVSGNLKRELNKIDPHKAWTWDPGARRAYRGYVKRQLPMWHFYRVEFYPHYGNLSGIKDKYGNDMTFPSAFRINRSNDKPKGIIKIVTS